MKKLLLAIAFLFAGCDSKPSSDSIQNKKQEELAKQGVESVGLPAIVNFQEKRTYKMILELRDTALKTITYIVDLNGKLHKICDSIGYGIPYATQFTNPQKIAASYQSEYAVLPQADPNGLFSPASADGTWVLCLDKKLNKMSPMFIEPHIIVSTFEIESK